jgi:hypothetical protein
MLPRLFSWPGPETEVFASPAAVSLPENKVSTSSALARKQTVIDAGGFPPTGYAEDLHLWLRMLERGSGLALPVVTAIYHFHDEQATSDPSRMWDARRLVITDYADRPWCTPSVVARHEAAIAWDTARASGRTVKGLVGALASPARAAGLGALLRYRYALRRASRRAAATLDGRRPA